MPTYDLVAFHAQQAAEKAVKALLVRHAVRFDKTHDVGGLLAQAEPFAPGIGRTLERAEDLTAHAVGSRYPGGEPRLTREDAAERLAVADQVVAHVIDRLRDYLAAGRGR